MKGKFDVMQFSEGEIVGRKDLFKNKEDFINYIKAEYSWMFELERPTINDIKEGYVRFYPKSKEDIFDEFPDGCYSFCEKGKGAFAVYFKQ